METGVFDSFSPIGRAWKQDRGRDVLNGCDNICATLWQENDNTQKYTEAILWLTAVFLVLPVLAISRAVASLQTRHAFAVRRFHAVKLDRQASAVVWNFARFKKNYSLKSGTGLEFWKRWGRAYCNSIRPSRPRIPAARRKGQSGWGICCFLPCCRRIGTCQGCKRTALQWIPVDWNHLYLVRIVSVTLPPQISHVRIQQKVYTYRVCVYIAFFLK